jgi:hypothetical protein
LDFRQNENVLLLRMVRPQRVLYLNKAHIFYPQCARLAHASSEEMKDIGKYPWGKMNCHFDAAEK